MPATMRENVLRSAMFFFFEKSDLTTWFLEVFTPQLPSPKSQFFSGTPPKKMMVFFVGFRQVESLPIAEVCEQKLASTGRLLCGGNFGKKWGSDTAKGMVLENGFQVEPRFSSNLSGYFLSL